MKKIRKVLEFILALLNFLFHFKPVKASSYPLNFRRYDTRENSFLDFARLIRNNYRSAWQVSNDPQAYAKEIAYSPYISELNGDNRETYRHSIIQITQTIQAVMALIGE